jgi:6-phospho-beta-glucosidase
MTGLRICVIGGGSVYTPELVAGFIKHKEELPIRALTLMDINEERLQIVGGLAQRMFKAADMEIKVELTTNREEALADADYIIIQIRVGGIAARTLDEKIPLGFGIVGQETVGPGGFANALRTIPVILEMAEDAERLAPNSVLINFTNPSGMVTEALLRYTKAKAIGLCNVPITMKYMIASWLNVDPGKIFLDYVGLNHLSWVRGVHVDREDFSQKAWLAAIERAEKGEFPFSPELIKILGLIPSYYLRYYYHHDEVLAEIQKTGKTRAEVVAEIDAELLRLYSDPGLTKPPPPLGRRGGAHYSTAAVALISAMHNNKGEVQILNVQNLQAIPELPEGAVVEVPCVVTRSSVTPLPQKPLPPEIRGLVQAVKAYEELTIKAAAEGDEKSALQALLAHPFVTSFAQAKALWEAIKKANQAFLTRFSRWDVK